VACRSRLSEVGAPGGLVYPVSVLAVRSAWLCLVFCCLWAAGCSPQDGEAGDSEPAWVSEFAETHRQSEEATERAIGFHKAIGRLEHEGILSRLAESQPAEPGKAVPDDDSVPKSGAVREMVLANITDFVDSVESDAGEVEKAVSEDIRGWKSVAHDRFRLERELIRASDDAVRVAQYTSLLSARSKHFWLWSTVGIASLLVIVFRDRRQEFRRVFNGGRAKTWAVRTWKYFLALGILLGIVSLLLFVMGEQVEDWIWKAATGVSPRETVHELVDDAKTRQEEALLKQKTASDGWDQGLDGVRDRLSKKWLEAVEKWQRLVVAITVREQLASRLAKERSTLASLHQDVKSKLSNMEAIQVKRRKSRLILGGALLAVVFIGHLLFWVGVWRRRRRTGATCPQCMSVGRFVKVPAASPVGHPSWECQEVAMRDASGINQACGFRVQDSHREMAKLSFPTLGIPQAGKTHWLAMAYQKIALGDFPINVRLDSIDSPSADQFDRMVSDILRSRIKTQATQTDRIPDPLVFEFQDDDPWGQSDVLLNMFDYSGEVILRGLDNVHLVRALRADGYLFFLDPMFPPDEQVRALRRFRDHVSTVVGRSLRTPVALCVSKIDLLETAPYGNSDNIRRFYSALQEIGEDITLDAMSRRSAITRELRDTIWPGWNIEREVDEIFGGRFQFFPMTPVGLESKGEKDLSKVTIRPFAVLEPLLWLLHMTGHPIFTK
jgi:hypothetical protein